MFVLTYLKLIHTIQFSELTEMGMMVNETHTPKNMSKVYDFFRIVRDGPCEDGSYEEL